MIASIIQLALIIDASTKLMKCNEGRCNSTLSPKEAEYQAWKRRQSYKPFHASTPTTRKPISGTTTTPATLTLEHKASLGLVVQSGEGLKHRNSSCQSNASLQRSASFHYPDGMHKVQVLNLHKLLLPKGQAIFYWSSSVAIFHK